MLTQRLQCNSEHDTCTPAAFIAWANGCREAWACLQYGPVYACNWHDAAETARSSRQLALPWPGLMWHYQAYHAQGGGGTARAPAPAQAGPPAELVLYAPAALHNTLDIPVQLQLLGCCQVAVPASTCLPLPPLPAPGGLSRVAVLHAKPAGCSLTSPHINLDDAGSQHVLLHSPGRALPPG